MNRPQTTDPLRARRGPRDSLARASWTASTLLLACLLWAAPSPTRAEGPSTRAPEPRAAPSTHRLENLAVDSVRIEENFLLLDDQRYVVTPRSRCMNGRGKRVGWDQLPKSGTFDVRYQTRRTDEESPYSSRDRILLEIRELSPPKQEKGAVP